MQCLHFCMSIVESGRRGKESKGGQGQEGEESLREVAKDESQEQIQVKGK